MTFFDSLILWLLQLALAFTGLVVCVGACIVALILLMRDCTEKRHA